MINLELTEDEAFNLRTLLGMHSTYSVYDTFPVFEKLSDAMDQDLPLIEQIQVGLEEYKRSQVIRQHTAVEDGLIVIKRRA